MTHQSAQTCCVQAVTLNDHGREWSAYELRTDKMAAVIAPQLGGKIVQITNLSSGRAWLWRNPHLPYRMGGAGESYVRQHDTGGWDDLLPTVSICDGRSTGWPQSVLTDHGEIWYRQTKVVEQNVDADQSASLSLEVIGDAVLPLKLMRTYRAVDNLLEVQYELHNPTDRNISFIWTAHPAFALDKGARIILPVDAATQVASVVGEAPVQTGDCFSWPSPCGHVSFTDVPDRLDSPWAVKLFACADQVGLAHADGETMMIACEAPWRTWIGLWLNYGGWSGAQTPAYFNAVLEPTTSPCDGLDEAISRDEHACIDARATLSWSVAVRLFSSGEQEAPHD